MHKICKWTALLSVLALLTGCTAEMEKIPTKPQQTESLGVSTVDPGEMFTKRDYQTDYDAAKAVTVTLNGKAAQSAGSGVEIAGTTVRIGKEGTYILSGTLEDGQIVVDGKNTDKIHLVLNGVEITGSNSAAIWIQQADKVFITTAKGTENILSSEAFAESEHNIDAVIFSKDDLTLNGQGSLTVESPAGHGIVSKDDLAVTGGSYRVTCAGHGLAGKDSVRIGGGDFAITAGKDGIHGENEDDAALGFGYISGGSFTIQAEGDGIAVSASLLLAGGNYTITAGGGSQNGTKANSENYGGFPGGGFGGRPGGRPGDPFDGQGNDKTAQTDENSTSMKGIKASGDLTVQGGTFTINSADDGVHSNTNITVTGGDFQIATGDDGFHADERLTVSGGTIQVTESYEGLEGHHILFSGGEIRLVARDDGFNAAGGTDSSGMGGRDQMFGGKGGPGGPGGPMGQGDGSIVISGGTVYIQASGDGIDANGTLKITGGHTTVCGPTQGDTATLDYDVSGTITGGTFIGTGGSMMAQSLSGSDQGVIALRVGNCAAGTPITLTDAGGNTVLSATPALDYAVVILSSPEIVKGETYTVTIGTQSGSFEAN